MTNPVTHRVRVEPKRVQTFLFEVPRLRAMVGANVLLGEFLRFELADAYLQIEAPPPGPEPSDGAAMDSTVDVLDCAIANWGASLQADMRKRYFKHGGREELLLSDKPHDLRALGIFSREGGHFHALFTSLENAQKFVSAARSLAEQFLPGIRLDLFLEKHCDGKTGLDQWQSEQTPAGHTNPLIEAMDFDLPVFVRCPELPRLPANAITEIWRDKTLSEKQVSHPVALRYRYGKRYVRHEKVQPDEQARAYAQGDEHDHFTLDVASLLRPMLPFWHEATYPRDFDELAGGGYMAVIHIDGNGMGARSRPLRQKSDGACDFTAWEKAEAGVEQMFYEARRSLRNALVIALGKAVKNVNIGARAPVRPYQLMMAGGDDVLLVCRADLALPFVVEFAEALRVQSQDQTTNFKDDPLTIGAGVVISKPSLPFHRLHAVAEELASSAKALFRARENSSNSPASVVDWVVTSNAWIDDPISARAKDSVVQYGATHLALSRKPYVILKDEANSNKCPSLQTQLSAAYALSKSLSGGNRGGAARNQLKALYAALRAGLSQGELAWRELPEGTRNALVKSGCASADSPWIGVADTPVQLPSLHCTDVIDVVEIMEIDQLARQTRRRSITPTAPPEQGSTR